MAHSNFSKVDEYGFERHDDFDFESYEEFMSVYLRVLATRAQKWATLLGEGKSVRHTNTVKRYVRKGIPSEHRPSVWMAISGADKMKDQSPDLFHKILDSPFEKELVDLVKTDLPRTFPDNIYFTKEANHQTHLFNILIAYAHNNRVVGYCQGLNYIAGLLLLSTKSEEVSFWLLKVLVEKILPDYYTKTMDGLIVDIEVLSELVKSKVPDVHQHVINLVIDKSKDAKDQNEHTDITRSLLLSLRLGTLAIMVALLTLHLRSVRVFRWEQSVSGGLLITYLIAVVGLALCAGNPVSLNKGVVLQTYLCGTGAALLALNAACLWRRWHHAGDLTRAVADLLSALGVPLRQQEAYNNIATETKVLYLVGAIQNGDVSEEGRQTAAVLLRRLFSAEFFEFFPKLPFEQQAMLREQLLLTIQMDVSQQLRRKICDVVSELARSHLDDEGANQWPEFLQFMLTCASSQDPNMKEAGIRMSVPGVFGNLQNQNLDAIKRMLFSALQPTESDALRVQAVKAVGAFILLHDKEPAIQKHLSDLLDPMMQIIVQSMEKAEDDSAIKMVGDKEQEDTWRQLALEVMVTLCETAPAMVRKQVPMAVRMLTPLVLEMINNVVAESALDRICCGLGGKTMLGLIVSAVPVLLQSEDWRRRHAALMAVSSAGEGCHRQMEQMLDQVVSAVLNYLTDPHPRVRYAACNAVGQMSTDFAPIFEKKFHDKVVPIGEEKFLSDASEVMDLLLKTHTEGEQLPGDDPQTSFLISAWSRICRIMGKNFAQYLPMVMEPVMRTAAMKPEVALLDNDDLETIEGSLDWHFIPLGDQQNFGIKTAGLEDKASACEMLVCYARELKEAFAEYAEDVVKLMVPMLKFYFHDGVRTAAAESLPYLLECARIRGHQYIEGMWAYILPELLKSIDSEPEQEVQVELLNSLAKCIELLGTGCLGDESMAEVVEEQLADEDNGDVYGLSRVADVLHALMAAYREAFFPHLDTLLPHLVQLMAPQRPYSDRQWAICIFDDVIEFGGQYSPACVKYQDIFLEPMLGGLCSAEPEVRQAAAYGCGVLAQFGGLQFADACARAVPLLAAIVAEPDSRSIEKINATENAISAVTKIIKYNHAKINRDEIIRHWLTWLPVVEDTEEAPHVYALLCELAAGGHAALTAPDAPQRVLALLAEAFLHDAVPTDNPVYAQMVALLRQIQSNGELFNSCLMQLSNEHKEALQLALST
ncbi:hypothetical protein MSG28_000535 [Choristoneura fumiferana]|uniref:Uncharacterized protein n=1 Tax=Choristoneura fumiferana TaxID=7141 RepID=A0ACC0K1C1_CHOFU|nr:hypothetical protein MSG28_000535 [Choristoneura fumiferana]